MNALPYTITSSSFTQPSVGSTVSVPVRDTSAMASGQVLYVDNGGYYTVSSITDGTHVVLANLGSPGNASPTSNVASGSQVSAVSPNDVTGVLPAANQQAQTVGGDLSGTTASATVVAVQGLAYAATTPTSGQVPTWNGSEYAPTTPSISNPFTGLTISSITLTNGGTYTLSSGEYGNAIIVPSCSLSGSSTTTIVFPNQVGLWLIPMDGITASSACALEFQSGTATVGVEVGGSFGKPNMVLVLTRGSNTINKLVSTS